MDFNYDFEQDERRKKAKKILLGILRWILELAAVVALAYVLVVFTIEQTDVIGSSMETTLQDGDTVLINKLAYIKNSPKRYDVIVFKKSGSGHQFYNIKRIIGLPGETIQILDGEIYINGEMLIEPVKVDKALLPGFAETPITLEEDEYFVLGDNRNESEDSRFASVGNVVAEDIIGVVWIRFSPFTFVNKSNKSYIRPTPTQMITTEPEITEIKVTP